MALFKILKSNDSCVLLRRIEGSTLKVMDIEGDTIYMGYDDEKALEVFDSYDINAVRKQKEELFSQWLKTNAQPF